MGSGAGPRSPIGRRKSGRESFLIRECAYIDSTPTRLEAGPNRPTLTDWTDQKWACIIPDPNSPRKGRTLHPRLGARPARGQDSLTLGAHKRCRNGRRRRRGEGGGGFIVVVYGHGDVWNGGDAMFAGVSCEGKGRGCWRCCCCEAALRLVVVV